MSTSMRGALQNIVDGLATRPADGGFTRLPQQVIPTKWLDDARAALSSSAPDRLRDEERASIESARKALSAYRETLSDGQLIAFPDLLEKSIAIIDRLSRQPEAEPVAAITDQMVEAACRVRHGTRSWNANVKNDKMQAWVTSHREHMRDILTAAFATSPRLDRERLARTLYRRLVLNPPADFDDASADLQNEWLQLADAIMRETL